MSLLIDTCGLLALARGDLSVPASTALRTAPRAEVSPVVAWEIGIKVKAGKLQLPEPPLRWVLALCEKHQLVQIGSGLDARLLCAAADLPLIHRDPFDRVLIATALRENLILITSDRVIPTYPRVKTLW